MDPISLAVSLGIKYIPELVGYLFGDNAEEVAKDVGGIVKSITGSDDPADQEKILAANPQLVADLRKQALEIKDREDQRRHEEAMAGYDRLKAEMLATFADIGSARARDTEIIKQGKENYRADIMLFMAFVAVIAIAGLLALGKVDGATAVGGFLLTIGGMFARNIGTAFDFEFGSSRGQQHTTELLSQAPAIGGKNGS